MDPSGNARDWWAMFKSPVISGSSQPTHANGTAFWYLDDSSSLKEVSSNVGLQSVSNPLYSVLKPLYPFSESSGYGYLMLNDQLPSGVTDNNRAHAKGFFVFDQNGGIYVEHSTPKFPLDPKSTSSYAFADSTKYGQSYMCVSLDFSNIEALAQTLLVEHPHAYSSYIPSWASSKAPSLTKLADMSDVSSDLQKSTDIKAGRSKFTYLAKSKKWGKDLYKDYIAPFFKSAIYVETWPNGSAENLPSDCSSSYPTYNMNTVVFGSESWTRTKDHSKWAAGQSLLCIGGINRQDSQETRGGGALCKVDSRVGSQMKSVYTSPGSDVEQC